MADILLLGTNGYSGRLTARYLLGHPQRGSFTLALAARTRAKVESLGLPLDASVKIWEVDVSDDVAINEAVQKVSVVLNCVGPYWYTGGPIVEACVRHGKHYVDVTGEVHWMYEMIKKFDFHATRTRSIIVPACGLDSVPSDAVAYLANRTVKTHEPTAEIEDSLTAVSLKGGASGGTLRTILSFLEDVPPSLLKLSQRPYVLSPIRGAVVTPALARWFYALPPPLNSIRGGAYAMASVNRAVVERTWGLHEYRLSTSPHADVRDSMLAYGPRFRYDEFVITRGTISAFFLSFFTKSALLALALLSPLRWLVRRLAPAPGQGPSERSDRAGYLEMLNVSTAVVPADRSPFRVRTSLQGKAGPQYLTAVMVAESALLLLNPSSLPDLAREGGILTPMSAFGGTLLSRLEETGIFVFSSEVIDNAQK